MTGGASLWALDREGREINHRGPHLQWGPRGPLNMVVERRGPIHGGKMVDFHRMVILVVHSQGIKIRGEPPLPPLTGGDWDGPFTGGGLKE